MDGLFTAFRELKRLLHWNRVMSTSMLLMGAVIALGAIPEEKQCTQFHKYHGWLYIVVGIMAAVAVIGELLDDILSETKEDMIELSYRSKSNPDLGAAARVAQEHLKIVKTKAAKLLIEVAVATAKGGYNAAQCAAHKACYWSLYASADQTVKDLIVNELTAISASVLAEVMGEELGAITDLNDPEDLVNTVGAIDSTIGRWSRDRQVARAVLRAWHAIDRVLDSQIYDNTRINYYPSQDPPIDWTEDPNDGFRKCLVYGFFRLLSNITIMSFILATVAFLYLRDPRCWLWPQPAPTPASPSAPSASPYEEPLASPTDIKNIRSEISEIMLGTAIGMIVFTLLRIIFLRYKSTETALAPTV